LLQGRHPGNQNADSLAELVCQRLRVPATRKETSGRKAAQRYLRDPLENNRPVMLWCDLAELPYQHIPAQYARMFTHIVVACGFEGEDILIDDLSPTPWRVNWTVLNNARNAIGSLRNRLLVLGEPEARLTLKSAVELGLRHCVDNLLNPKIQNFGVQAIEKWSQLMTDAESRKGWPQVFQTPRSQFNAMRDTYHFIQYGGFWGGRGMLRGMFADFLVEASEILQKPALAELAPEYQRLNLDWQALGNSALPDVVGFLKQARQMVDARQELMQDVGPVELPRLCDTSKALNKLEAEAETALRDNDAIFKHLFADMADQLRFLHRREHHAAEALAAAIA
jgi:hypothetical protein